MSYLSHRRQFTEVNNCKSATDLVHFGVPQGSLLGPRLYSMYVNDLSDNTDSKDLYMYADDTMMILYTFRHFNFWNYVTFSIRLS